MSNNYDEVEKKVIDALSNKLNILVSSKPGSGKNYLVNIAAEKAGLKLFSTELYERNSNLFDEVGDFIKKEKANALLIEASPGDDITRFIKVTSDLNIPLIVTLTNNTELKADTFKNKDDLLVAVKQQEILNPSKPKDFISERLRHFRVENNSNLNKSKPKS